MFRNFSGYSGLMLASFTTFARLAISALRATPCATLLSMNPSDTVQQKRLTAQWQETGRALDALRYAALARQSPAESRQAAYDMLQLGGLLQSDPELERGSGLVEMQRLFGLLRACERA